MRNKATGLLISAILGIMFFTGCVETSVEVIDYTNPQTQSSSETAPKEKKKAVNDILNQTTHLNIALQPIPGYLPLTVLQDKGWLEEALKEAGYKDVEVNFTEFESGPPEREAVAAGSQDIGVMGNVPTITGVANGQHLYILGVAYNGEKTEAVLIPNSSSISSVSGLKGKRVGLVVGSIAQDYFSRLLKEEGIRTDDLNLVDIDLADQLDALSSGKVDAVVTWQPTLAKAEALNVGKVLADGTGVYKCENLVFGNMEYVEMNPDIVQIFFQQYARAVQEVSNNRRAYAEASADKYGLDASMIETILEDICYPVAITEDDIEDFQKTADWLYEADIVQKKLDVEDCVNDVYANDESVAIYLK